MKYVIGSYVVAGMMSAAASAAVLQPTSGGLTSLSIPQGGSLMVDISLGSDSDRLNIGNGIWTVTFSKPGLSYAGYEWSLPFVNGSENEASSPKSEFPVPLSIATYVIPGSSDDLVDIYFENSTSDGIEFNGGKMVTLNLQIPSNFELGQLTITAMPDQFGTLSGPFPYGDATSGVFTLTVTAVPEPSSLGVLLLAGLILGRRRRVTLDTVSVGTVGT